VPLFFVARIFFCGAKMHGLRRFFVWSIRGLVFVLLFGLALKNQEIVDLHFFFGQQWGLPVSLIVLGSFALGALLGLTVTISRSIAQDIGERTH
jgi:putative membrane protein